MTHKKTALIAAGIILVSIVIHIETYKHISKRYTQKFEYFEEYIVNQDSTIDETLKALYYYREKCDTYSETIDSLKSEIFVRDYKFARMKEYCDIVKKDQTQQKFLRGWIMRVLDY